MTTDPRAQLAQFFRAGLRSNGSRRERRLYKRLWARIKLQDPEFRRHRAEIHRRQSMKNILEMAGVKSRGAGTMISNQRVDLAIRPHESARKPATPQASL